MLGPHPHRMSNKEAQDIPLSLEVSLGNLYKADLDLACGLSRGLRKGLTVTLS